METLNDFANAIVMNRIRGKTKLNWMMIKVSEDVQVGLQLSKPKQI